MDQHAAAFPSAALRAVVQNLSTVKDRIANLDEIVDEVLVQLGIPDSDKPGSGGRTPKVNPKTAKLLQDLDDLVDSLQKDLGIPDPD